VSKRGGAVAIAALAAIAAVLALLGCGSPAAAAAEGSGEGNGYRAVPGGRFASAAPLAGEAEVTLPAYALQEHPVTNAEFLAFVRTHPQWQRGAVPVALADPEYLSHWQTAVDLGSQALPEQPVTRVSWFAAEAYCEAQGATLPTWNQWERAAAASESRPDARADPEWRQRILDWYAHPATGSLAAVGRTPANFFGIRDLHGLIWEWVLDFNTLLPPGAQTQKFCGAGAVSLQQKENYAVLMRVAMLGSLNAANTGRQLGFRCAREMTGVSP
jgi:formylglycine-generating enzyme required for sulfatase activity